MDWIRKNWSSAITLGCLLIAAFIEAWQEAATNLPANVSFPRLQGVSHYIPLGLLTLAGVVWLIGRKKSVPVPQSQAPEMIPGIPSLSALLGQSSSVDFDAKKFFALAYYSPVTAELEKNIKAIAQKNSPNDKEAFYARFIGVGAVAYQHDVTWFIIYGSQLAAMEEMNSLGLIPVADLKKHYDEAVVKFPKTYQNYSFEQWLAFMKERLLIAVYPSQMVELSFNGKDFLKYLAHVGKSINKKAN